MTDIAEDSVVSVTEVSVEPGQDSSTSDDEKALMTGFMAVKVTLQGRSRTIWQDIGSGVVRGYVDRYGRQVVLDGPFEAQVVDGQLLDSPGTKGEPA